MKQPKTERFILVILILICLLALIVSGLDAEAKELQVRYLKYKNDRQAAIIQDRNIEIELLNMLLDQREEPESKEIYAGEFTVTAYCGCKKCCGQYALNRPNGIVTGAAGVELKEGVSVASPLPFGTRILIDGKEYISQDRTSEWVAKKYDNKIIDMYFEKHEDAEAFGKQTAKVYIVRED